jgi:hypothetical protein
MNTMATEPYKVGSTVQKCCSVAGDGHGDGARGRVVSVLGPMKIPGFESEYGYFVHFDDFPIPVFVYGDRVIWIDEGDSRLT